MTTLHDLAARTPGLPCRTTDPELWFSRKAAERALAVALCQECPLRRPCAQYAIDHPVEGVWGGSAVSPMARARLRGRPWRFDEQGRVRMVCGSEDAYRSHIGYREQPCEACTAAHEALVEEQRRERLDAEHANGGSAAGFWLHRRLGEDPCPVCRAKWADQQKAAGRRRGEQPGRGRSRAAAAARRSADALSGAHTGAQPLPIAS
ncbi:WhiB family transcriptional regulator [Streptomyces sp. NPDC058960]|uniref:WhiB family transcriptional regulator n=1 Tax=Streptomyces sp. NPDC058960 TaxID=3346679 RepID=UPI0036A0A1CE